VHNYFWSNILISEIVKIKKIKKIDQDQHQHQVFLKTKTSVLKTRTKTLKMRLETVSRPSWLGVGETPRRPGYGCLPLVAAATAIPTPTFEVYERRGSDAE